MIYTIIFIRYVKLKYVNSSIKTVEICNIQIKAKKIFKKWF